MPETRIHTAIGHIRHEALQRARQYRHKRDERVYA